MCHSRVTQEQEECKGLVTASAGETRVAAGGPSAVMELCFYPKSNEKP